MLFLLLKNKKKKTKALLQKNKSYSDKKRITKNLSTELLGSKKHRTSKNYCESKESITK